MRTPNVALDETSNRSAGLAQNLLKSIPVMSSAISSPTILASFLSTPSSNPSRNTIIAVLSVVLGILLCLGAVFFLFLRWRHRTNSQASEVKGRFWGPSREERRTELGVVEAVGSTPSLVGHDPFRPPSTPPRAFTSSSPPATPPASPSRPLPLPASSTKDASSESTHPRSPSSLSNISNSTSFLLGTRPVSIGNRFEDAVPKPAAVVVASSFNPFEEPRERIVLPPLPGLDVTPPSSWGRHVGKKVGLKGTGRG
ncbi:hypothetical protein BDY24DRAFT_417165 [Mrakia frigida]|uniref:uncharacterized protein n=1 Tax=Mrakia frigida TaxID=29902 RepID=UPI003FCC25B7